MRGIQKILGLGLIFVFAPNQGTSSEPSSIEDLFRKSQAAHREAQSYADWSHSPYGLEGVQEKLSQQVQRKDAREALCRFLAKLPSLELYYFSDFLADYIEQKNCLGVQAERYEQYLDEQQSLLFRNQLIAANRDSRSLKTHTPREIFLDAEKTPVIMDGGLPEKTLVLTFDDGPHATRTESLLSILEYNNIWVNFFLVGRNVKLFPDVVRLQNAKGHDVGCHSFTHADLRKLSPREGIAEIEDGFAAIFQALGSHGSFFRFPYGAHTTPLRSHLVRSRTVEFFWNIDTLDWKHKDPTYLLNYSLAQVEREGRGVVLFHDIQPQTIAMMPAFIETLRSRGYSFAVFRPSSLRRSND